MGQVRDFEGVIMIDVLIMLFCIVVLGALFFAMIVAVTKIVKFAWRR